MRHDNERRLAVGGVHALDGTEPCRLDRVEPAEALADLGWANSLVVRADGEGQAELVCGDRRTRLRVVEPARLDVVLVGEGVPVGERFQARAVVRDRDGHELEIGKWTEVAWRGDGVVELDRDRSAGEFGMCDSCFGVHGFRAATAGAGTIEGRLGDAVGTLKVTAR